MTFFQFIYAAVPMVLAPVILPLAWCYANRDPQKKSMLAERLGHDPDGHGRVFHGNPKIWIHAVSVGEVKAAESIVEALFTFYPNAALLLTTTTTTGQREAVRRLGGRATVVYAPVDVWPAVRRFLSNYRPDVLICMETEIWPNWILQARRNGIKITFLNGRLSTRSIQSYMNVRFLLKSVLRQVDAFSMISDADAGRIIALGAPARRVQVNGNVKTDMPIADLSDKRIGKMKQLFSVTQRTPVFICGSVRGAEVEMLVDVCDRLAGQVPDLLFIIAPRHIENASRIERRALERGLSYQRRTELEKTGSVRTAQLVVLDTIGELRDVYGLASVVFGGASLVPLGGQNILEAAVWAKPVLFGPHMDDFYEEKTLLEASGGGICVQDVDELVDRAAQLLMHPGKAQRLGALAREAVLSSRGAAMRHAQVVAQLLSGVR